MTIHIPKRYLGDITKSQIQQITSLLKLPTTYTTSVVKRNGRYILIENLGEKYYIIVTPHEVGGRNSYLAQFVPTVLTDFTQDRSVNKKLYVFLSNTSHLAKTAFHLDVYRMVKTLGFTMLNESQLGIKILPYSSFQEWKNLKERRRNANTGNLSSFAIEDEGSIIFYSKLFGANGKEGTLTACTLASIARKENSTFRYIQVKEHDVEEISETDKLVLEYYGIETDDVSILYPSIAANRAKLKSTCRDQDTFKYNLYQKFGPKKCYLCECDIDSNIIASHIHRIADIDKSNLSSAQKIEQATDGDNGFWLCANHDKLFEYGLITFNYKGILQINISLDSKQIDFIDEITKVKKMDRVHITKKFLQYLQKHNTRLGIG